MSCVFADTTAGGFCLEPCAGRAFVEEVVSAVYSLCDLIAAVASIGGVLVVTMSDDILGGLQCIC